MSDHKTNQAMLPPDPGGLNRALDRAAAEHLRSVAPLLAPCLSCQAGLCAEHGPTVTATTTGASAPPLGYGTLTPTPRMLLHSIGCIRGHGCVPGCTGVGPIPLHPGQAGYEEELLAKAAAHAPAQPQPEPTGEHVATFTQGRDPFTGEPVYTLVSKDAPAPPAEAKHHEEDCVCRECRPELHSAQPPAEAPGEMSREELEGTLWLLSDEKGRDGTGAREVRTILAAFDSLRTRARAAEYKAEARQANIVDTNRTLERVIREAEEARRMIAGVQPDDRAALAVNILRVWPRVEIETFARHLLGTRSPEEESLLVGQLMTQVQIRDRQLADQRLTIDHRERERDEAREQREDLANEILAGRSDLAAANARAEEAERRALMAGQDKVAAQRRADSSHRLMENERAARVKAEAERDRLRECHRTAAETVWEVSVARTKVEKALAAAEAEREAYRQDRDLTAHRLAAAEAENGRLQLALNDSIDRYKAQAKQIAAAEAEVASLRVEVSRLRLVYDDPSLDATDGAHPAWWRGSDAGVAGAVRIVNEALDGPLPLVGCVGGADLEAVRQRVAALRASVARLVETGDEARDILNAILDNQYTYRERVDAVDRWVARWAAAKAGRALDAPAGSEARR